MPLPPELALHTAGYIAETIAASAPYRKLSEKAKTFFEEMVNRYFNRERDKAFEQMRDASSKMIQREIEIERRRGYSEGLEKAQQVQQGIIADLVRAATTPSTVEKNALLEKHRDVVIRAVAE